MYCRVLTGSNHHVTLTAGIDQGYSSRSGARVGMVRVHSLRPTFEMLVVYHRKVPLRDF